MGGVKRSSATQRLRAGLPVGSRKAFHNSLVYGVADTGEHDRYPGRRLPGDLYRRRARRDDDVHIAADQV